MKNIKVYEDGREINLILDKNNNFVSVEYVDYLTNDNFIVMR